MSTSSSPVGTPQEVFPLAEKTDTPLGKALQEAIQAIQGLAERTSIERTSIERTSTTVQDFLYQASGYLLRIVSPEHLVGETTIASELLVRACDDSPERLKFKFVPLMALLAKVAVKANEQLALSST